MNREIIVSAISQAAESRGYIFHCDNALHLHSKVHTLPAVWLEPPQFVRQQGRHHGTMTYSVKMHALQAGFKLSSEQRHQARVALEEDVLAIFSSLSQNERIIAVEDLSIRISDAALTSCGEVAVTAAAEIVTHF